MKLKSPLSAYKSDLRGFYGSPRYVEKAQSLGVDIGKSLSKVGSNIFTNFTGAEKEEPSKSINSIGLGGKKHEGFGLKDRYTDTLPETPNVNTNLTKGGFGRFTDKDSKAIVPNLVELKRIESKDRGIVTKNGKKELRLPTDNNGDVEKGSLGVSGTVAMMKGSPVKHNDQQEVSNQRKLEDIMKQPGSLVANAAKFMRSRKADRSAVGSIAGPQPQSSAISIAGLSLSEGSATPIGQKPTGSIPGGAGLFGAAAQASRAAAASQESLPLPNQVAESGSYAGTGDRILEMDSNPVANQSIGRDTDITSQLFGSGQRASMLAMKGFAKSEEELIDETKFQKTPKKSK